MKKNTLYSSLLLLLAMLSWRSASAQIQFTNPQFSGSNTDFRVDTSPVATTTSGSVPINPSNSYPFSVTVYRNSSSSDEGYVSLYSGVSSPTTRLTNTTTGTYSTSFGSWTTSGGVSSKLLSGSFSTSLISSGDQKLYAVFTTTTGVTITSASIALVPGTTTPGPSYPSSPPAQSTFCLNAGAPLPKLDAGYFLGYSLTDNEDSRIKWEVSVDNGVNYRTVYAAQGAETYDPPANIFPSYRTIYGKVLFVASLQYNEGFPFKSWKTRRNTLFTVNVIGEQPVAVAPVFVTCGASIGVAVQRQASQLSYNWQVPYAGWTVSNDGTNPVATSSSTPFTTTQSNVIITPPSNAAPGDYVMSVSAMGSCGSQSASGTFIVRIDQSPTPNPDSGSFYASRYDGCRPVYGYVMTVPQGTGPYQYLAVSSTGESATGQAQSNGSVTFPLEIYGASNYASISIYITGPCGRSQPYNGPLEYLSGPDPSCGGGPATSDVVGTAYPNPATESLTIPAGAENATLFDKQGSIIKHTDKAGKLDVQSLPEGLYNLQMMQNGKLINQRIQVKH
jgi:hypothetical protein